MVQSDGTTNIDGIVAESSAASPVTPLTTTLSSASLATQKAARKLRLFLIIGSFAYILPGLFLVALFPRTDGQLAALRLIGTAFFAIGVVVIMSLFIISLSRIGQDKEHPRLRFFALIRLVAFSLPLLIASAAFLFLINRSPQLSLEVLSPVTQDELVAPVAVTFGMQTALQYFQAQQHLTPLSFQWDFNGDGAIDQDGFEPQATFIFSKANIFPVTAVVTMSNGVKKKVSRRLFIPRSSFSVSPPQIGRAHV